MRKHTSRAQQPGLCPDGLPNRAMRRQQPTWAAQAAFRAFNNWYWVASNLIPGYLGPTESGLQATDSPSPTPKPLENEGTHDVAAAA